MVPVRLGIDVGGTFTDVVLLDEETSAIHLHKLPSTVDPSRAMVSGIEHLLARSGIAAADVSCLVHGTTIATNAVIEGRGARTALLTTRGFRDLLEIGRQVRPGLYDLNADKPPPLVPRSLRLEVDERLLPSGTVLRGCDPGQVRELADQLAGRDVEAVAVCLLYSFLDPAHELAVAEALNQRLPGAYISLSHQVHPEFREYERTVVTTLNARLGPLLDGYLSRFERRIKSAGITAGPRIMQSNGGTMTFDTARRLPVRTIMSGPSAGVVSAAQLGTACDVPDLLCLDMGGTSADISLITDRALSVAAERVVGGLPLRLPMVDVSVAGAGGGSIARVDPGGLLQVGPDSAGANPGPACYNRGGTRPTVTDAGVVLGWLNPAGLLDGQMPIEPELAKTAVGDQIAAPLGVDLERAAAGIVTMVVSNMVGTITRAAAARSVDVRELALVASGGAGPVHAGEVARELGCREVIVPPAPGNFSALGLVTADTRGDFSRTMLLPADGSASAVLGQIYEELEQRANAWLAAEGVRSESHRLQRTADMRYRGQNFELEVPIVDLALAGTAIADRFHELHCKVHGFALTDRPVQFVTMRVAALGGTGRNPLTTLPAATEPAVPYGKRSVCFFNQGGWHHTPIYRRYRLAPGHSISGPAVIEQLDSTTIVAPDQRAEVDQFGALRIRFTESSRGGQ